MARPKRLLHATADETSTPPAILDSGQNIAKIIKPAGNNLYNVSLASGQEILVEMPSRFRSTIWVKRGTFVVVDTAAFATRENKLDGQIVNVVRDEKKWRKQSYWPSEYARNEAELEDGSEEESIVGKMPPSDSDDGD